MTSNLHSAGSRLRQLLGAAEPFFLMGAHDGMSARIATSEGFPALWASGLCMSTALGVRDSDEASWTQLLSVVETIIDASGGAPVLVDGDTGYGNFNTARRFSCRAERIGAAGVCFEDKVFPKMNSFVGNGHELADVTEFSGKITACKDAQSDPGFVLVARTETLIAGRPVAEAIDRANAYADAGADAVFIHSRQKDAAEIEAFASQWGARLPLVIAPTTYHDTPLAEFARIGISGVIWANQSMRAAFSAMRDACRQVLASSGITGLEPHIASLAEVFSLLRYDDLEADEFKYTAAGRS